jgi:hypothetical protein
LRKKGEGQTANGVLPLVESRLGHLPVVERLEAGPGLLIRGITPAEIIYLAEAADAAAGDAMQLAKGKELVGGVGGQPWDIFTVIQCILRAVSGEMEVKRRMLAQGVSACRAWK